MTAQRRDEPKGLGKDEISDSEEEPQTSAYGGHARMHLHAHMHMRGGQHTGREAA